MFLNRLLSQEPVKSFIYKIINKLFKYIMDRERVRKISFNRPNRSGKYIFKEDTTCKSTSPVNFKCSTDNNF